ncbi:hypothetical protein AEA09_09625 [Lysinibacillus contaminans]|uniref:Uncharacterized protein n=1 Tax=Lysinibacillus contaminans TaxID=1293441 RepID=A0ABR5K225_9BACI|nr:hypothetical protein AEA09_09625 [Lysinibacillus contaminans]
MQLESIFNSPSLSTQLFIILSIVSIIIGLCLIIFGFVRQKNLKKSTLATCCIIFGILVIVSHTIQIIVRMLL